MKSAIKKKSNTPGIWQIIRKNKTLYLFMLPFMLVFFIFTVWPVVFSFLLSFTSFNVFETPRFVGWDNYTRLFVGDEVFGIALNNTFVFAVVTGPVSYVLSLFFAWVINDLPKRIRSLMTLVFYIPSISGNIFAIWLIVFDGDIYGYLNSFLMRAGFIDDPIQWLKDPRFMMLVVIIVQLWISLGVSFLAMRAGFNTIDRQYYEAAAIDGIRNRYQELWHITLPMMKPHLMLSAVLSITAAFGSFQVASTMTGFPSVNYATHTIMHHMIDYGYLRFERGYAAAIATLLFAVSFLTNQLFQKLLGKVGK